MGGEQGCWQIFEWEHLIALIFPVKSEASLSAKIEDGAANIGRLRKEKEEKELSRRVEE